MPIERTIEEMDKALAVASLGHINDKLLPASLELLDHYRELHFGKTSEPIKLLEAFRYRAYRKRETLEQYAGTVYGSQEVTNAIILTPEKLKQITDELGKDKQLPLFKFDRLGVRPELMDETSPIEINAKSREALERPESKYIIDAIYSIITEHAKTGKAEGVSVTKKEDEYVLVASFDEICKRSGVTGEMRRKVKDALIPYYEGGKLITPYLSYIHLRKGKYTLWTRFISVGDVFGKDSSRINNINLGNEKRKETEQEIVSIELHVHKVAYTCLDSLHNILVGKPVGQIGSGYFEQPNALAMKIGNIIAGLIQMAETPGSAPMVISAVASLRRDQTRFYVLAIRAMQKWKAGDENRKADMQLTSEELRRDGLLSQTKNKPRRERDMFALWGICEALRREGEAFIGCKEVKLQEETLVFVLSRP